LESETINSVIPRIFLILSIGTVYGSDAALYVFSSISQQINLRSENLNSHGFCASYSEVRRFITSVALKEEESIKEGVYVPDGIVPVCQGGCLIQEGADNIDINTEIIDGKDTFHYMARAVFQVRPRNVFHLSGTI
jgi:hypothetical protein